METIEALRLIARGFERERTSDRQAKSAVPTILAAVDELAALRKDAERYRWLRTMDITHEYGITNGDMSDCPTGAAADAAIDAEMLAARAVGALHNVEAKAQTRQRLSP